MSLSKLSISICDLSISSPIFSSGISSSISSSSSILLASSSAFFIDCIVTSDNPLLSSSSSSSSSFLSEVNNLFTVSVITEDTLSNILLFSSPFSVPIIVSLFLLSLFNNSSFSYKSIDFVKFIECIWSILSSVIILI